MSLRREASRRKVEPAEDLADRLSALPDGPLQHVLSFLPSRDAVRTCVLARRWISLWKSVPAVRISGVSRYESDYHLNSFVRAFLRSRDKVPVREMDIESYVGRYTGAFLEPLVQYGLSNSVEVLRVSCHDTADRWRLPDGVLISTHLTQLEVSNLHLEANCLDFSSCSALMDLRMEECAIETIRITSPSVTSLSITSCHFDPYYRTHISFPSLISLILADCEFATPVLESMPLLASAFVRLETGLDCCDNKYETGDCGDNKCSGCCIGSYAGNNTCVLGGLSACTSLELISQQTEFIFRRDLIFCPIFHKLKTLLLNDWCMTLNLDALCCLLQHAPILQKLTIQFAEFHEDLVYNGAKYDMVREPLALEHLSVEVKCNEVDERISRIVDLLCCSGVPSEKLKILPAPKLKQNAPKHLCTSSMSFSFEQKA